MKSSTKLKSTSKDKDDDTPKFQTIKMSKFRSFAIYGRSNTGKTTLASTFPGPLLYLDVRDRGTDSIFDVKDIKKVDIESMEDLDNVYWWLLKHPEDFKTVILDTVSQLQQLRVVEQMKKGRKVQREKKAGDWGSMSKRDWGDVAADLKEKIIDFRNLQDEGMNMVFIAQDRTFNMSDDDDETEGELAPEVGPALSPSVAKVLNAAVSVIGNTFIREHNYTKEVKGKKVKKQKMQYCLRIGPNPLYVTKIRKPRSIEVPDFIVDPTYEDIIDIMEGN